jgi:hypothetical protein
MATYFTVDQANAALVLIRPLMGQLLEIRQVILSKQPELEPMLQKALGNGGSSLASEVAMEVAEMQDLVLQIQSTGALFKDVNSGLVDFLSKREGMDVFLCWRFGEEEVRYWHDLDAGFAGRQPI